MAKLKAPLMSLKARGRLTKLFSLARRQGRNIIEKRPRPTDAESPAQLFNRHMFTKCVDLWHLLSEAEKAEWERLATPRHMTGYAWYISQCLRPNPGIYLPLQGGTMSGNIDMAKNRLLKLPTPTANQEAANKLYADTHGMQAHENTHVSGGSDEIDEALAIEAMADLATGKIWQGDATNHPSEVDPPVGVSIATGSYTGNTTARQIAVGFKCSAVIILTTDGLWGDQMVALIPNMTISSRGGQTEDRLANGWLHAADGFGLDNSANINNNGSTYYYWAISE